ncbi:MAG: iron chaperone [Erysipelotrichaceae bacterium]|nr:iron chaperone [Erysipelotrichaceae bacterium]
MDVFTEYLFNIKDPRQQQRLRLLFEWIIQTYPQLKPRIAWNQPMFTDHGTFIIGFSIAKGHLAAAPERLVIDLFSPQIIEAGYQHSKELIKIGWHQPVDYDLLTKIINFNIADKKDCQTFWRK